VSAIRQIAINLLKILASLAIVGYLFWDAVRNEAFDRLWSQEKLWGFLILGALFYVASAILCFIRWGFLVRALGVPFTHREAIRLSLVGYLVNLAPMGVVGGDLVKMILLARLRRCPPAEAVASVLVDRALGLYMLFVVASAGILFTGFAAVENSAIQLLCRAVLGIAFVGALAVVGILAPAQGPTWLVRVVGGLPIVGKHLLDLGRAIRRYRSAWPTLLGAAGLTVILHSMFTTGVYFFARGLFGHVPSWGMHFVLAPVSISAGVIPLPMGPFEFVLDRLYLFAPVVGGQAMQPGQGLLVALTNRVVSVMLAAAGIGYYFAAKGEVAQALDSGQSPQEIAEPDPSRRDISAVVS